MREVFEYLDKDKSGKIDSKELIIGLRILGLNPTEGEVKELLNSQDKNHDGVLDLQEFTALFEDCK